MAKVRRKARLNAKRAQDKVQSKFSVSSIAAIECPRSAWTGAPNHCHWCNAELEGRRTAWCSQECHQMFEHNHIWNEARKITLRKARYCCERCKAKDDLQVNHIDPVVGRGYFPSCFHHLDNLETLCRPHHQVETNKQREHRQTTWTDDALTGHIVLPSAELEENLRQDVIRRMLDRRSGFPFLLPNNNFAQTGEYMRYRPNTKWKTALADLQQNYPDAIVWESEAQAWVSLAYYGRLEATV